MQDDYLSNLVQCQFSTVASNIFLRSNGHTVKITESEFTCKSRVEPTSDLGQ